MRAARLHRTRIYKPILVDSNRFRSFVRPGVLVHCSDPVFRRNGKIEARYIVTVFSLVISVQHIAYITKTYVPSITYVGLSKFDSKKYRTTVAKQTLRTNLFSHLLSNVRTVNVSQK
jgi:hypothetical protein